MVYVEPRTGKIMRRGAWGTRAVPHTYYNLSFTASQRDVYITVALAMYITATARLRISPPCQRRISPRPSGVYITVANGVVYFLLCAQKIIHRDFCDITPYPPRKRMIKYNPQLHSSLSTLHTYNIYIFLFQKRIIILFYYFIVL